MSWVRSLQTEASFPPIASCAFISDCEVNALIAPSGNIEWMCVARAVGVIGVYIIQGSTTPRSLNASSYPAVYLILLMLKTYVTFAVLAGRRRQESRADKEALETTIDPAAFRRLLHRISTAGLSELDARGAAALGCSHPSPVVRIAHVQEWEERAGVEMSGP